MADRKGLKDELQDQSPVNLGLKWSLGSKVMSNSVCSYEIINELVVWIGVHITGTSIRQYSQIDPTELKRHQSNWMKFGNSSPK